MSANTEQPNQLKALFQSLARRHHRQPIGYTIAAWICGGTVHVFEGRDKAGRWHKVPCVLSHDESVVHTVSFRTDAIADPENRHQSPTIMSGHNNQAEGPNRTPPRTNKKGPIDNEQTN